MSLSTVKSGILLVGHGTRQPAGQAEFRELSAKVAAALEPRAVEAGYLELVEPTIGQAFDALIERGVEHVLVVPLLLFAAGHVKRDIPTALQAAAAGYPGLDIEIMPPLGGDEQLLSLSGRRFREAIAGRRAVPLGATYWLLVGRGSSDPCAIDDLKEFAVTLASREGVARFGFCVVAASRPTLSEGLDAAATAGLQRIVVQPHLLFQGAVLDQIASAVKDWERRWPDIEWITTAHLGVTQEVIDAVLRRAGADSAIS